MPTVFLDAAGTLIRLAEGGAVGLRLAEEASAVTVDAGAFGGALAGLMAREAREREELAHRIAGLARSRHRMPEAALTQCVGSHPYTDAEHRRLWQDRYRQALRASGQAGEADSGFPAALVAAYDEPQSWEAYPDVPGALREAWRRGIRVVVASNFSTALPRVLEGLGLAKWVGEVGASADLGFEKPDLRFYRRLLDRVGQGASEAVLIGDDLVNDVVVPRLLGMGTLWLRRGVDPGTEAGPAPAGWSALRDAERRMARDLTEALGAVL